MRYPGWCLGERRPPFSFVLAKENAPRPVEEKTALSPMAQAMGRVRESSQTLLTKISGLLPSAPERFGTINRSP